MFKRLLMQNPTVASSISGLLMAGIVSLITSLGADMDAETTATVSALCGSVVAWALSEITGKINIKGVKEIQESHGLEPDGWAGPKTQEKLKN